MVRPDFAAAADFAALGASIAAPPPATAGHDDFEVMPDAWPAVTTFLACATCWRWLVTPAGPIRLGLDYPAVDVVVRRRDLADPDGVFDDIQVMERAALKIFRETT